MVDHSQKWLSGGPLQHDDGQTMVDHDQFMVDHGQHPEQTIWTWFHHGGPCFSNAVMVCSMVNHGLMAIVILSQSWSSLMDDPVILTMVQTWLSMVTDGPFQIQEKLQYETWMN